jgi:hypothetical protein
MLRTTHFQEAGMKNLSWLLIALAAVAFVVSGVLAVAGGRTLLFTPPGFWRGAMGLLLFAIALRVMEDRKA